MLRPSMPRLDRRRLDFARLNSLSCEGSSVVIEPGRAVVVTLAPPMWLARQAKTGRKTLAAGDHVLLQPGYVGHHLALAMAFTFLIRTLSLSPSCVRLCFVRTTLACLYDSILSLITLACCVTRRLKQNSPSCDILVFHAVLVILCCLLLPQTSCLPTLNFPIIAKPLTRRLSLVTACHLHVTHVVPTQLGFSQKHLLPSYASHSLPAFPTLALTSSRFLLHSFIDTTSFDKLFASSGFLLDF